MRRGALILAGAGLLTAVALSGCSAAQSTMSISYLQDGEEHTVSTHPETVECTETDASTVGVQDPKYSVQLHFDDAREHRGSAWLFDETLVHFAADELVVEREDGHLRVDAAPGVVSLMEYVEDEGQPRGEFDLDGATEVEGTLTVDLVCEQ
jgi:hypothetical protein